MRKAALTAIGRLIEYNESVVFIGSDLGAGTLADIRALHPGRVLMEGIAEQHLVGFAAGLALEGYVPYVHTIGTFLTRRALEQVIVDVALHNLPVRLVGLGGGMAYAPLGPTHQSIDDFALMRAIPNMLVVAPADPAEMIQIIEDLSTFPGPAYIRVGKGGEPDITSIIPKSPIGSVRKVRDGTDLVVLTTGTLLHECIQAVDEVVSSGLTPALVHVPFLAPLDKAAIEVLARDFKVLLVVEEHLPTGGLTTAVSEIVASRVSMARVSSLSLPNAYASTYGSQQEHLEQSGLTSFGIAAVIRNFYL